MSLQKFLKTLHLMEVMKQNEKNHYYNSIFFTYNGKSSKCTKSTVTTTSVTATKYTNKVAVQTIKRSVSLSCSKSGILS
mgnify:CR=1 FL=1